MIHITTNEGIAVGVVVFFGVMSDRGQEREALGNLKSWAEYILNTRRVEDKVAASGTRHIKAAEAALAVCRGSRSRGELEGVLAELLQMSIDNSGDNRTRRIASKAHDRLRDALAAREDTERPDEPTEHKPSIREDGLRYWLTCILEAPFDRLFDRLSRVRDTEKGPS